MKIKDNEGEERTMMAVYFGDPAVYSYTHMQFQADSKKGAEVFFVDGEVPEVGDEIKFVVQKSEQAGDRYYIHINMEVVRQ